MTAFSSLISILFAAWGYNLLLVIISLVFLITSPTDKSLRIFVPTCTFGLLGISIAICPIPPPYNKLGMVVANLSFVLFNLGIVASTQQFNNKKITWRILGMLLLIFLLLYFLPLAINHLAWGYTRSTYVPLRLLITIVNSSLCWGYLLYHWINARKTSAPTGRKFAIWVCCFVLFSNIWRFFTLTITPALSADDIIRQQSFPTMLLMWSIYGYITCFFYFAYEKSAAQLMDLSSKDGLTGLLNQRTFKEKTNHALIGAHALGVPTSLIFIDLDYFKRVNDQYGHQVGDIVLIALATSLKSQVRSTDIVGRYGGEEFGILVWGANLPDAVTVAEHLRNVISTIHIPDYPDICITASLGVIEATGCTDLNQLLHQADTLLYQAKTEGRNRCVFTPSIPRTT